MKNILKTVGQNALWGLLIASSAFVGVSIYDLKHTILKPNYPIYSYAKSNYYIQLIFNRKHHALSAMPYL